MGFLAQSPTRTMCFPVVGSRLLSRLGEQILRDFPEFRSAENSNLRSPWQHIFGNQETSLCDVQLSSKTEQLIRNRARGRCLETRKMLRLREKLMVTKESQVIHPNGLGWDPEKT